MLKQDLYQSQDGGSMPTSPLQFRVAECKFKDITDIFYKYHYKKSHMGGGISLCLALKYKDRIIGGAVIGLPRHAKKYAGYLEIRRMACIDEAPKNSESYFLSKVIWWLKRLKTAKGVLSYADMSVGHVGTIYKAANFKCIGETSASKHVFWNGVRYHPRSLSIDRPYSYRLRQAVKDGTATIETMKPKKIYVYDF